MKFEPVRKEKISEMIAAQIKEAILEGDLMPGDKIPPERELMERFEASRVAVREAIKSLEATGLVIIRRGSGIFVGEGGSAATSDAFSSALKMQKVSEREILEARLMIEPSIARLAAVRITMEEIEALRKNIDEASQLMKKKSSAGFKNIDFHLIISRATHNRVITLAMEAILGSMKDRRKLKPSKQATKIFRLDLNYHKKLFESLREMDPEKSGELMRLNIIEVQSKLEPMDD